MTLQSLCTQVVPLDLEKVDYAITKSVNKFVTLPLIFFFWSLSKAFFSATCSCFYSFQVTKLTNYLIGSNHFMIIGVVTDSSSVDILQAIGPKIIMIYYVTT